MQQGGGQSMQQGGPQQPCFKCKGNGYCHSSSMAHDKGPNERCFFCENCDGCGGSGAIKGQSVTVVQTGGMGMMGMNMGGPSVVTTSKGGLQPCFKCKGRGYCHESSMTHDKGEDEKCFFCKDCDTCDGSGAIKGGTTTVQQVGGVCAPPIVQVGGMHMEMGVMKDPCADMNMGVTMPEMNMHVGGSFDVNMQVGMPAMNVQVGMPEMNVQMGGMGGGMQMGMGGGMQAGMMGGATTVETTSGPQPCFKCKGNGFCHESSMDHDKGPNEKCFFCKDCDGCGGSGAIKGGNTTVQQVGMPGMMGVNMGGMGVNMNMGGMMGGPTVVETTSGPQPCFKCKGNGWCHESTMDHDKDENEKCFFCKDCNACGGSGAIQGGTTTQTRF